MADQTSMAVQSPTGTVESFFDALQDQDFELAENLLAQNLVFQNVGMPTIYGRNRAMKMLRSAPGRMSLEVKIHRIAADGAAVLTERTDAVVFGPLRVQFWVCGVFEVHDGRITLWRDYFDALDVLKATVRGVVGVVVPAVRAKL